MVKLPTAEELEKLHGALEGTHLDILGCPWLVEVADLKDDGEGGCRGKTWPRGKKIAICESVPDPMPILVHEAIHAVEEEMNIDLGEKKVVEIERVVVQVLRHNPIFKKLWQ